MVSAKQRKEMYGMSIPQTWGDVENMIKAAQSLKEEVQAVMYELSGEVVSAEREAELMDRKQALVPSLQNTCDVIERGIWACNISEYGDMAKARHLIGVVMKLKK